MEYPENFEKPDLISRVMNYTGIKNERIVLRILLAMVIVALLLSFWITSNVFDEPSNMPADHPGRQLLKR